MKKISDFVSLIFEINNFLSCVFYLAFVIKSFASIVAFFFPSAGNVSRQLISYYKYLKLTAIALYVFECLLPVVTRRYSGRIQVSK